MAKSFKLTQIIIFKMDEQTFLDQQQLVMDLTVHQNQNVDQDQSDVLLCVRSLQNFFVKNHFAQFLILISFIVLIINC